MSIDYRLGTGEDAGIATITIARPEVRNALDRATLAELADIATRAGEDPEVRVIVLTGGPDAFCTGEDLREAPELTKDQFVAQIADFQRLATALRLSPKPVLAAIGGPAVGGGVEIALDCDVRIAADNAVFLCPEVNWGLTITNAASVLLRRTVGESWARELMLFGTAIDADTALRIGLVTRVVAPERLADEAISMARAAAGYSAEAIRLTKSLINADPATWQQTLDAEADAVTGGFGTPDVRERLTRFMKRKRG